jgi:hypothetical protein
LPPEDYRQLVEWFGARDQERWDEQLDAGSSTDRHDFVLDEAESELSKNFVREWPPR